jgi:chromosomal replication initiator protein
VIDHDIWDKVAHTVRSELSEAAWSTWFRGVHPVHVSDSALVLGVPNSLARDRLRTNYLGLIEEAARDIIGPATTVELLVTPPDTDGDAPQVVPPFVPPATDDALRGGLAAVPAPSVVFGDTGGQPTLAHHDTLNPRYTFEQFVIGSSNRFAHAAALSVAESPARSYNPLFIYGPAGLGKTHLLHAIGQHVLWVFRGKSVRYVSTETMMNEFVDAMRTKSMPFFKRRYRDVDILLVDDIQFLERTEQLQEEFFYTFNDLHSRGSQIVISSDRPPKSIGKIEDRLRSRFEWGLITDIQPPEFETRLAILRKKAEAEDLEGIPDEVLEFIAENIVDNVRELEGSLIRVAAYSSLNREPLSAQTARAVLADLLPPSRPRLITPELILEETSAMFGWSVDDLIGKSRRRPLVTARQVGMYVFRELTDYSYPRIAEQFGGRDHTTVMHACEKIRAQMAERRQIFDQVNELIARIKHGAGGRG